MKLSQTNLWFDGRMGFERVIYEVEANALPAAPQLQLQLMHVRGFESSFYSFRNTQILLTLCKQQWTI